MAKQKLEMVSMPEYLQNLVGTLGADPLQPVRASAEDNVIIWNKARLAEDGGGAVAQEDVPLRAYKNQSFIQRVKSRFKRVRLNQH